MGNSYTERLRRRADRARRTAIIRGDKSPGYAESTRLASEVLAKLSPRQRRRLYRQQFKSFRRWKTRIIPKTTIGLVTLVLAFSIGAATSGVILFAWSQYRIDETNNRVDTFVVGFGERFETAKKMIETERDNARAAIRDELGPLAQQFNDADGVSGLIQKLSPSVWQVSTLDANGVASTGSAWVVYATDNESYLVTSYSVVEASTRQPGPTLEIVKGQDKIAASLIAWQPERDLALIKVARGKMPTLEITNESVNIGSRIYVASGYGSLGASVTQGLANDVNADSIVHDASVGQAFRGGPILDASGKVVGIASRSYSPSGFSSDGVYFGVPVNKICEKITSCSGTKATPTTP